MGNVTSCLADESEPPAASQGADGKQPHAAQAEMKCADTNSAGGISDGKPYN